MPRLKESQGTMIFTGTLGATRTNAQFAACTLCPLSYVKRSDDRIDGAGRASVRMLAQALGKEFLDVHVVQ